MAYSIRTFGDPVLKSKAAAITDVDGKLVRLVDDMFTTLYESDLGIALAAPQIGVQKQVFVWDLDGERQVIFNPEIVESIRHYVQSSKVAKDDVPRELTETEFEEIKKFGGE